MPKKRAKGKASKAVNKAKKTEEVAANQAEQTTATNHEESLEAQTQRLKIGNKTQDDDDDAFLEDAIKLAAAEKKQLDAEKEKAAKLITTVKCNHGCDPLPEESLDCAGFMDTFIDEFNAGRNRDERFMDIISKANKAAHEKYPEVLDDAAKVGWILSNFLAIGTQIIIDGDDSARTNACVCMYFERHIAIRVHKTQSSPNYSTMTDMLLCDEHTLLTYYRGRIPCICLDEKYEEVAAKQCNHGCDPLPADSDCVGFMKIFSDEYITGQKSDEHTIASTIKAKKAARGKYPEVWDDSAKMGWILSSFLAHGTKNFLDGKYEETCLNASMANYFEQQIAIRLHKTQASLNFAKIIETIVCDPHKLVKYLRNRIPCKCLDKKYKVVKSITKKGLCFNPTCNVPGNMVERKGMLHCIRCRQINYCSRECQVAHWPIHKEFCDESVDRQAAFEAKQKAAKCG